MAVGTLDRSAAELPGLEPDADDRRAALGYLVLKLLDAPEPVDLRLHAQA